MPIILTVDMAVTFGKRDILLIERAKPPFMDKLVLPGGHVDDDDSSLPHAAARELQEETGLVVRPEDIELLMILDASKRDPRPDGRRVAVVYAVNLPGSHALPQLAAASDAKALHIRDLRSLKADEVGFDHFKVIERLRRRYSDESTF